MHGLCELLERNPGAKLAFSKGQSTLCTARYPGGPVCPVSSRVSQAPLEFPVALHPTVTFQVLACPGIPHRLRSSHGMRKDLLSPPDGQWES